jgi:hypothetical protein
MSFTVAPQDWTCPPTLNQTITYHATLALNFPQGGSEGDLTLTDPIEQGTIIG